MISEDPAESIHSIESKIKSHHEVFENMNKLISQFQSTKKSAKFTGVNQERFKTITYDTCVINIGIDFSSILLSNMNFQIYF